MYKCVVTDSAGRTVTSDAALLTVGTPLTITGQPSDLTVTPGTKVTFDVTVSGGKTPRTYQWQVSKDGGDTWTDVASASGKTAHFYFTAKTTHNGWMYHCTVTDADGAAAVSEAALLTVDVNAAPVITGHPEDVVTAVGSQATFTVSVSGTGLTYQWEYLKPGASVWATVTKNGTSATYQLTTQERHNGYRYRCEVTGANGVTATSNVALLTLTSGTDAFPGELFESDPYYGNEFPVLEMDELQEELWEADLLTEEEALLAAEMSAPER